jgi:hypothetical protein
MAYEGRTLNLSNEGVVRIFLEEEEAVVLLNRSGDPSPGNGLFKTAFSVRIHFLLSSFVAHPPTTFYSPFSSPRFLPLFLALFLTPLCPSHILQAPRHPQVNVLMWH